MSFVFDVNNAAMTGATAMFKLKELLKTAGWTTASSGDGLSAFSSSSDIISSGNSGANGFANTSAWVVMQMPSANSVNRQLMFQRGTTNLIWTIKYSYSTHFTGGVPSATVPGAATDSQTLFNNVTLFPADSSYRFNAGADNATPYGYWSGTFPTGGGNPNNGHCMFPLTVDSDSLDVDPYVFYLSASGSFANTDLVSMEGFMRKGQTQEKFQTNFGGMRLVQPGVATIFPAGVSTNPHTGNDDSIDIPVGISSLSTFFPHGFKGTMSVCRWNGASRTTGDTLSLASPGAKDRIVYKDTNLPWNGSTPTV